MTTAVDLRIDIAALADQYVEQYGDDFNAAVTYPELFSFEARARYTAEALALAEQAIERNQPCR